MPRFVLLYHDCPPGYTRPPHWDFMLEAGDILRTWALRVLPRDWAIAHARTAEYFPDCALLATAESVEAEALGDHRSDYLEFEGELSGNRGRVVRVAAGRYNMTAESQYRIELSLFSAELRGGFQLWQGYTGANKWTLRSAAEAF